MRFVELPAGLLDGENEAPLDVAKRELREEGACAAATWRPLTAAYSSPGLISEQIHYFLATDLTAIDRGDTRLVIDLSELEYISSTGLSAFLSAAKKIKAAGGRMALTGINSRIRLVFEMSGFLRLFPIFPTIEAALAG